MSGVGVWVFGLLRLPGGYCFPVNGGSRQIFSPDDHHVGAAAEALQLHQAAHVDRRGSSARSAPSPVPARYCAPASRPCRCSGPRTRASTRARTFERALLPRFSPLAQRLVAMPLAVDAAESGPSPSASPRSPPTDRRCPPDTSEAVLSGSRMSSTTWLIVHRRVGHLVTPHQSCAGGPR